MNPLDTASRDSFSRPATGPGDETVQFISFRIGEEEFAIDIMAVREIKGWTETTVLPNQPDYLLGVLNLRGLIVPIFDLRCRFGMGLTTATRAHVVIIVSVMDRTVGLLVDAVSDILTVTDENMQPTPDIANEAAKAYARGILAIEGRMICLIELDALFPHTESEAA